MAAGESDRVAPVVVFKAFENSSVEKAAFDVGDGALVYASRKLVGEVLSQRVGVPGVPPGDRLGDEAGVARVELFDCDGDLVGGEECALEAVGVERNGCKYFEYASLD